MATRVYVGVIRFELHIPDARSLKAKRSVTRSLVQRLKHRHQILVLETDHQELYQRAAFAVCAISTDEVDLLARLQRVSRTVEGSYSGPILSWDQEVLQL